MYGGGRAEVRCRAPILSRIPTHNMRHTSHTHTHTEIDTIANVKEKETGGEKKIIKRFFYCIFKK